MCAKGDGALKIKEYASHQGLTNSAVYNAVRRAGHSTKELTDKKGNITPAGFAILGSIYPEVKEPSPETVSERPKKSKSNNSAYDELKARLSEAEKRAERAEERAEKWESLYLELQKQSAEEREQNRIALSEAHVLVARAQESAQRRSFLRLFSGRKKKPAEADSVETHGEVN